MTGLTRGAFIVIEGLDRTGKSTQCGLLAKALSSKNCRAEVLKFPDRTTTIGTMIDSYLKKSCDIDDHAIHLLFSANRWEARTRLTQDLNRGITLIADRYAYSGVAYSSAKPGMDIEWCKKSDVGLPKPDIVMYMNLPADVAERRSGFGDERYEKKEFQKRVLQNFDKLNDSDYWVMIDAGGTVDEIHRNMLAIAEVTVEGVKNKDIGKLWSD